MPVIFTAACPGCLAPLYRHTYTVTSRSNSLCWAMTHTPRWLGACHRSAPAGRRSQGTVRFLVTAPALSCGAAGQGHRAGRSSSSNLVALAPKGRILSELDQLFTMGEGIAMIRRALLLAFVA